MFPAAIFFSLSTSGALQIVPRLNSTPQPVLLRVRQNASHAV